MRLRAAAAVLLTAAPVLAQDAAPVPAPEFDGMAAFEIIGNVNGGASNVLVSQGGEIFGCKLEAQGDSLEISEILMANCAPVITEARRAALDAVAEEAERQVAETARAKQEARAADQIAALRASVEELDDIYGVALQVAYLEEGCRVDRSDPARAEAFFERMDAIAAEEAERIGVTLPEVGEALDEAYDPAYDSVGKAIVFRENVETFIGLCERPMARQVAIDTLRDRGCSLTFEESEAFAETLEAETERRIVADGGEMLGTASDRDKLLWPSLFDRLMEDGTLVMNEEAKELTLVEGCAP